MRDWRSTRTATVAIPRRTRKAANGPSVAPVSICAERTAATRSRDPTTAPAITSEWPDRYFVPDSITRSAPCSSGRQTAGDANVLSTVSSAPCRWATSASAGRSARTQVGLAMVSTWRIRVRAAASDASTAWTSVVSTYATSTPSRPNAAAACVRVVP